MARSKRGPTKSYKLVCGVGVNDADYVIAICEVRDGKNVIIWRCPFYSVWCSMLNRCYGPNITKPMHTYAGCYVREDWHYFMAFRAWMVEQDWVGKQLDKDLLFPGNKVYSSDTCVFVDSSVNNFIINKGTNRGEYPLGVSIDKRSGNFQATIRFDGKLNHIGTFKTPEEAHKAFMERKREFAEILADRQTDPRVAEALRKYYINYTW